MNTVQRARSRTLLSGRRQGQGPRLPLFVIMFIVTTSTGEYLLWSAATGTRSGHCRRPTVWCRAVLCGYAILKCRPTCCCNARRAPADADMFTGVAALAMAFVQAKTTFSFCASFRRTKPLFPGIIYYSSWRGPVWQGLAISSAARQLPRDFRAGVRRLLNVSGLGLHGGGMF